MTTHVFLHSSGSHLTPAKAVTDYGFADLFSLTMTASSFQSQMEELERQMKESGDDAIRHDILAGVILGYAAEKSAPEFLKKKNKSFTSLEGQSTIRPWHYRDNDEQEVVWIDGALPSKDNTIETRPYAMLCNPITELPADAVVHSTAELAAQAALIDAGDKFPITSHYQVYGPYFGANPQMMDSRVRPKKTLGKAHDLLCDADEDWREHQLARYYATLKKEILARAKLDTFGWTELQDDNGHAIAVVPTLPLMCWALRVNEQHLPDYQPASPSGLRAQFDCRYHSDWMIGGGLDLQEDYYRDRKGIQGAAHTWARKWQQKTLGHEYHVLSSAPTVEGRVRHATLDNAHTIEPGDIVILPKGSVEYQLHVERACANGTGGVITELGSLVVHLAKVSRERQIGMMRIDNARALFPEGMHLRLDTKQGLLDYASTK